VSIPVALDELRREAEARRTAPYLLTVADDGRPHAVAVAAAWDGGRLRCEVGRRSGANASARPLISLVWPPDEPGGYSLIVDGTAAHQDGAVLVEPTSAVLHRPAPAPAAPAGGRGATAGSERQPPDPTSTACTSDCRRLLSR
jgi:hypothetical protein